MLVDAGGEAMIELSKGQPCLHDVEWVVVEGGTYNDEDLVEVVRAEDASQSCAHYAIYIANGEFPQ